MNPAVTLAYMFRADSKKIHVSLGLMMMGAQCLGAWLGALWYWFIAFQIIPLAPITILDGS
jgi:glycerol uptake facilitator-like aquaporin